MEKIKDFFRNLSLRRSIALHIVFFAVLALFLGNYTAGVCERASQQIRQKYYTGKDRYYLTNEYGEQLGEGGYIWMGESPLSESDERMCDFLDAFPVIMYPVYSVLAVFAAAMVFYRTKMKRPLELLTEASSKISENDLDFSVTYKSQDEMGQLCHSFEVMRLALEQNQIEMWRTAEERKRLNAAFAHDLRTPLTVLKGYNEMIQMTGGEKEKNTADIMAKHIVRMENYVDSMSRIQRLEDREMVYERVMMKDCRVILHNLGSVYCEQKGKAFLFAYQVTSEQMNFDLELILQVFQNLLSNAVRFAAEQVSVSVEEEEAGLRITVTDDGAGFSEQALKSAGEPYYHEKKKNPVQDKQEEENHFGLGLYICKTLCSRHGGKLEISNDDSGAKVSVFFHKS